MICEGYLGGFRNEIPGDCAEAGRKDDLTIHLVERF